MTSPVLDSERQQQLYSSGEYDWLSEDFLASLAYYNSNLLVDDTTLPDTLYPFLETFLTLFIKADYVIADKYAAAFIQHNTLLSNLVAMSSFRTTDAALEILRNTPHNLVKILTLYSARNTVHFERSRFFAENAQLASLWYYEYCGIHLSGLAREDIVIRLNEHLSYHDDHLLIERGMMGSYYGSTYVDGNRDREFKQFLNETLQRQLNIHINHRPDPRKIAVISDLWYPAHSVYRNYAAYVKGLKNHYHLTLLHNITPRENLDTGMFNEVIRLNLSNRDTLISQLSGHFQLAYFPDVGMTDPSIILSNCRIAPIQMCSPGHSVSTWGSHIDYFISGADVETTDVPQHNYSECLVLLPGMGVIHNPPQYKPEAISKKVPEIVINCPWSGHKIGAGFLGTLRKLLERASRPVRLRIFPNDGICKKNGYLPFLADLHAVLGENMPVELYPGLPYEQYMRLMEEADLTLDSFHFAGCNTVADSLFLRKPTIVWEGDKWYNRIGPAMLRLIGMEDCIAAGEEDYLNKALLLIHDDKKRAEIKLKLETSDLDSTIFSTHHAPAFRRAVQYLMDNHGQLQSQKSQAPIVVA